MIAIITILVSTWMWAIYLASRYALTYVKHPLGLTDWDVTMMASFAALAVLVATMHQAGSQR